MRPITIIVAGAAGLALAAIAARLADSSSSIGDDLVAAGAAVADQATSLMDTLGGAVTKIFTLPAAAAPYADAISDAELENGLPDGLLGRLLQQESSYKPDIVSGAKKSPVGAIGIAQFMPATAAQFGIDPTDPFASIDAAGAYLRQLFDRFGNWTEALAAYNWGQGNVARKGLAAAPLETRNYFTEILTDIGLQPGG